MTAEIEDYLADLLLNERLDKGFLSAAAATLGWENVRESIIRMAVPSLATTRRGEFGECLTSALLQYRHGYTIPVRKLRFKTASNSSLHSTDVLAVLLGQDGQVTEVCYVESKLRTGSDPNAAVDARAQLRADYVSKLPAILTFVAERLYESGDPLLEPFLNYMAARTDSRDRDSFVIGLSWKSVAWNETPLTNLEEDPTELKRLTVHAIRIKDLGPLTDRLFTRLGLLPVIDDD